MERDRIRHQGRRAMTSDREIYRAAATIIALHGKNAPEYTAMRADELGDVGDVKGKAVLLRVRHAVDALLQKQPSLGETVH